MKIVVESPEDFKNWLSEKPTLAKQWAEANAPAEAPVQPEAVETVVDTSKVLAQVVE